MFIGKKIGVAVCGGIAAYKICELIREIKRQGAEVRVMMTSEAGRFVAPLTLQTLSGYAVFDSLFESPKGEIEHIDLATWPDAIIVAPATANTLAKLAHGLADDIVSATILATKVPVVLAPAMNTNMWDNSATTANLEILHGRGFMFVNPEVGALASEIEGEGIGRLAALPKLVSGLVRALYKSDDLQDIDVVVSAGRTDEYLDPVRMMTNRSTGKMGFAIAEMAAANSANVTLISGPSTLTPPDGVSFFRVTSALEMLDCVAKNYPEKGVLIMAAAVSDYRPREISSSKLKKSSEHTTLELVANPDILAKMAKRKKDAIHIGFAVETEDGIANATQKLRKKKLDMIVLNNPKEPGAGFEADTNKVKFIFAQDKIEDIPLQDKRLVAHEILQRIVSLRNARHSK